MGLPAAISELFPNRRNTRCCGHVPGDLQASRSDLRPEVRQTSKVRKRRSMFLVLGFVLLLLWLGGFFVFHVTAFFIHILLLLAVVSIIFHFMRGAASAV